MRKADRERIIEDIRGRFARYHRSRSPDKEPPDVTTWEIDALLEEIAVLRRRAEKQGD